VDIIREKEKDDEKDSVRAFGADFPVLNRRFGGL
jgi:hypothetical protein